MAEFKLTISNKKGKTTQLEVKDAQANILIGRKIGDKVEGKEVGITDYEFEITGGSDYAGFPMRRDVQGTSRKKIFAIGGTGIKKGRKGMLQRKTVAGNTIHSKIVQVNLKVTKEGKEDIFAGKPAEEAKSEAKEEKSAEEKKPEPKEESKEKPKEEPKEKPEEKPKEEKKPKEEVKEEKPKEEKA